MDVRTNQTDTATAIGEMIAAHIAPALNPGTGEIIYCGFRDGLVFVEFVGSGSALKAGMKKVLLREFPEIAGFLEYADSKFGSGLETQIGQAVQQVIDTQINPQIASHGGRIILVDVFGHVAHVRMEGGCQGCGKAGATLKDGVAKDIQEHVPAILRVLDVTDHSVGSNPFYGPVKAKKKIFSLPFFKVGNP